MFPVIVRICFHTFDASVFAAVVVVARALGMMRVTMRGGAQAETSGAMAIFGICCSHDEI